MAKTIAATVTKRISLGGTDYLYLGTLVPDTEYETGGDTITKPAAPALTLPEKIDYFTIEGGGGGYYAQYVPGTGKIKIFVAAAEGNPGKEVAAKANLSAQTFIYACIGC